MTRTAEHRWLSAYAWLTALATLVLICVGGIVTSRGAGMAVPDWPNSYGYNMFFFPVSKWVGNIFYEHSHRLVASGVGLMTVILTLWLWLKESRSGLRWLGVIALLAVILQGVLGGLRVVLFKDEIGILHATLAQLFLALVCAIALLTSGWWSRAESLGRSTPDEAGLRRLFSLVAAVILVQLILGATMRHQHAGLAIPDFPRAYGRWWPDMDSSSVARYNQQRSEVGALNPITPFQISLQMVHRANALVVLLGVAAAGVTSWRRLSGRHPLTRLAMMWLGLVLVQAFLGAATIWTGKSADIATAHVAVGALCLATGLIACLVARRTLEPARARVGGANRQAAPVAASVMAGMVAREGGGTVSR